MVPGRNPPEQVAAQHVCGSWSDASRRRRLAQRVRDCRYGAGYRVNTVIATDPYNSSRSNCEFFRESFVRVQLHAGGGAEIGSATAEMLRHRRWPYCGPWTRRRHFALAGKLPACEAYPATFCACSLPSSAEQTCRGGGIGAGTVSFAAISGIHVIRAADHLSPCAKVRNRLSSRSAGSGGSIFAAGWPSHRDPVCDLRALRGRRRRLRQKCCSPAIAGERHRQRKGHLHGNVKPGQSAQSRRGQRHPRTDAGDTNFIK